MIDHSEINRQRIEGDCHRRLLINALKSETVAIGTFIHCEDRGLGTVVSDVECERMGNQKDCV